MQACFCPPALHAKGLKEARGYAIMLMSKQKIKTISRVASGSTIKINQRKMKTKSEKIRQSALLMAAAAVLAFGFIVSPLAQADQFQDRINQLQADNAQKQQNVTQLNAQADSYQGEVDRLQGEIDVVRAQIAANEAKRDDLAKQITAAEVELAKQKKLLGENIKAMYVAGEISTLEMLASSKNLSEFLDKQQYQSAVQDKIKNTLDKINELKAQLRSQKELVEKLLQDQNDMNSQLTASQNEQARLLSLTEAQKAEFTAQIRANNAEVSKLRAQQAAANAKLGGQVVNGGACAPRPQNSYPDNLCNRSQDSIIDSWGMYNRECVSYTAWKVYESGRHMPYWGGFGNANQWDDNAIAAGIPVDRSPRAGDVAVSNSGFYGHVMYVESVNGNGTINISQYNYNLNGTYSEIYGMPVGSLVFIHFP
jgi:surface antigen